MKIHKKEQPGHSGTDKDRRMIHERWADYSISEKAQYVLYYYWFPILAVVIGIAALIFMLKDMHKEAKENGFYVMVIESVSDEEMIVGLEEGLMEALGLDPEFKEVRIEAGYSSDANFQSEATISTYMQSGRVDLVIAPEDRFSLYASTGYLMPLDEAVPDLAVTEAYDIKNLFYSEQVDYSGGGAVTELPFDPHTISEGSALYGVYLDQEPFKGYVLGVMLNAPHLDHIKEGFRYFLGN